MTERATIGSWKRTALAVMLAYALALQGLLLALGGAMHAQASTLPEQTVLCLQGSGGDPSHDPATTDHGICCLAACVGGTGPIGPTPAFTSLQPLRSLVSEVRPTVVPARDSVKSAVLPVGSRAPPRLG